MKILITGTSKGIGLALAKRYLELGHEVYGLDLLESSISNKNYHHFVVDVSKKKQLPEIEGVEILINNAGLQNCKDDISNNLKGKDEKGIDVTIILKDKNDNVCVDDTYHNNDLSFRVVFIKNNIAILESLNGLVVADADITDLRKEDNA